MKILIKKYPWLFLFTFFLLFNRCEYDYVEPTEISITDTVSFSNDLIPIFENDCAKSGCHPAGGIPPVLTPDQAYNQLILYDYVDTAQPEASVLYERMASDSKPMPPSGKLPEKDIQMVLTWIKQGAKNN